jgi:glycosyltransferase involved in cell wall biosynthesis
MRRWLSNYATKGLACSRAAAAAMFGPDWADKDRCYVLSLGIDLAPFHAHCNFNAIRSGLSLPHNAFVIGHVGRFVEQKNHLFLMQIALEVLKRENHCYFLLIGDGPLRPNIERLVAQNGLADNIIFAGVRTDVPFLMRGAMDMFLFPSLFEGLGLVLVEAQAAGLPCVISDVVPDEAEVVRPLVRRLSLEQPASAWAEAIIDSRRSIKSISNERSLKTVEQSQFNIMYSVKTIEKFYDRSFTDTAAYL